MDIFIDIVSKLSNFIWDYFLLFSLLLTGVIISILLKFPQFRYLKQAFQHTFGTSFRTKTPKGEISSFQAFLVALAAQVGTGNIIGVGAAILLGGPGAVFWMWISAIFGAGTIFSEAVLAQLYSKKEENKKIGGPAYYIIGGFKDKNLSPVFAKFLAAFFAISLIIGLGLIGNMVQSNSITAAIQQYSFGKSIPVVAIGFVVVFSAWLIFKGGILRIIKFLKNIVPLMIIIYLLAVIWILISHIGQIIPAFGDIFMGAFSPEAVGGGLTGITIKEAVRHGVSKGLFSNEAGMGSTPHAHATAKVTNPIHQGMTGIVGIIFDTIFVATATALAVIVTGTHKIGLEGGGAIVEKAFTGSFGSFGLSIVVVCLVFFAFTTILSWYYFGETNVRYLFGKEGVKPYQFLVFVFVILGSLGKMEHVWLIADLFNGIMVIPNLIAIWILISIVIKKTKEYDKLKKSDK